MVLFPVLIKKCYNVHTCLYFVCCHLEALESKYEAFKYTSNAARRKREVAKTGCGVWIYVEEGEARQWEASPDAREEGQQRKGTRKWTLLKAQTFHRTKPKLLRIGVNV